MQRSAPFAVLIVAAALLMAMAQPAGAVTPPVPDQWAGTYATAGNSSANPGEHVITPANAGRIAPAFAEVGKASGPYPPVVLGGVVYSTGGVKGETFTASSARTGAVLWTLALPAVTGDYSFGMTGTGSTVMISFRTSPAGGVLAVNVAKRAIAWRSFLPPSTMSWIDRTYPGEPITDGTRVYLGGSSNGVNAYSVTTGALLWAHPLVVNSAGVSSWVTGMASAGGHLFTIGDQGLVAYSASTGKPSWVSGVRPSRGSPVVVGNRVLFNGQGVVEAFPATGCGHPRCDPVWVKQIDSVDPDYIQIVGADSSSVFLGWRSSRASGPTACQTGFVGNLARLSPTTGQVQWHVTQDDDLDGLVRGGDVIWAINESYQPACPAPTWRILGYSATGTASAPIATIDLPDQYTGLPQTLAVASGTLLETARQDTIVGYRIPGT